MVRVRALTNVVDPEGVPNPVFPLRPTVAPPGPGLDLTGLAPSTHVELLVGNVRLEPAGGLYTADLRVRNRGPDLGRRVVVVFPGLPSGVQWLEPSGTDAGGAPYVSFRNAIGAGGLASGDLSDPVRVSLDNPGLVRFTLSPQVLVGGPNQPPVLAPVGPLTVMPGGRLEVALMATDPEDDPVRFSLRRDGPLPTGMLEGDGTLVFTPTPAQVGAYNFTVVASDGALEATGDVLLTVEADPVTTTRLSGTVLTTGGDPLASVSIELGALQTVTSGDGSFEFVGTGDTLVIHGELIDEGDVYPFIAEKVVLLLGHGIFPGTDNVIARPIFLPALDMDNAVTIDPTKDTTVTTEAIPGGQRSWLPRGGWRAPRGPCTRGIWASPRCPRS